MSVERAAAEWIHKQLRAMSTGDWTDVSNLWLFATWALGVVLAHFTGWPLDIQMCAIILTLQMAHICGRTVRRWAICFVVIAISSQVAFWYTLERSITLVVAFFLTQHQLGLYTYPSYDLDGADWLQASHTHIGHSLMTFRAFSLFHSVSHPDTITTYTCLYVCQVAAALIVLYLVDLAQFEFKPMFAYWLHPEKNQVVPQVKDMTESGCRLSWRIPPCQGHMAFKWSSLFKRPPKRKVPLSPTLHIQSALLSSPQSSTDALHSPMDFSSLFTTKPLDSWVSTIPPALLRTRLKHFLIQVNGTMVGHVHSLCSSVALTGMLPGTTYRVRLMCVYDDGTQVASPVMWINTMSNFQMMGNRKNGSGEAAVSHRHLAHEKEHLVQQVSRCREEIHNTREQQERLKKQLEEAEAESTQFQEKIRGYKRLYHEAQKETEALLDVQRIKIKALEEAKRQAEGHLAELEQTLKKEQEAHAAAQSELEAAEASVTALSDRLRDIEDGITHAPTRTKDLCDAAKEKVLRIRADTKLTLDKIAAEKGNISTLKKSIQDKKATLRALNQRIAEEEEQATKALEKRKAKMESIVKSLQKASVRMQEDIERLESRLAFVNKEKAELLEQIERSGKTSVPVEPSPVPTPARVEVPAQAPSTMPVVQPTYELERPFSSVYEDMDDVNLWRELTQHDEIIDPPESWIPSLSYPPARIDDFGSSRIDDFGSSPPQPPSSLLMYAHSDVSDKWGDGASLYSVDSGPDTSRKVPPGLLPLSRMDRLPDPTPEVLPKRPRLAGIDFHPHYNDTKSSSEETLLEPDPSTLNVFGPTLFDLDAYREPVRRGGYDLYDDEAAPALWTR